MSHQLPARRRAARTTAAFAAVVASAALGAGTHLAQENLVAAGSIVAILPPMLLFAMLNRYYVRGLFAGATKG